MPLIIVCGILCTGKSSVSRSIKKHFEKVYSTILHIQPEDFGVSSGEALMNGISEISLNKSLRDAVHRHLGDPKTLVIIDACNLSRSFRYELYCLSRAAKQPHCLVWCNSPFLIAKENAVKTLKRYDEKVFLDIALRLEEPCDDHKWDQPCFEIDVLSSSEVPLEDLIPYSQIQNSFQTAGKIVPVRSTRALKSTDSSFLSNMSRVTGVIVSEVVSAVSMASTIIKVPIKIDSFSKFIEIPSRRIQPSEIHSVRSRFLAITEKTRSRHDVEEDPSIQSDVEIAKVFCDYLERELR
ncbi:putative multi-domain containing protein [Aduncisulcus paluster]|uniref:Multi-domain containing protein n=1 Tax=Aduncisulcus paluster TaxID=2918883 RepID=A0ABQ5KY96_9EUKA|nr:putative multi-domain containing protein [Aduncisulcus paluster]